MPIINLDEVLGDPISIVYKSKTYAMAEADEEDYLRLARWGELATQKDENALASIRGEVQGVLKKLLPDFPWEQEKLPFPALAVIVTSLSSRLGEQMKAAGVSPAPPTPAGSPVVVMLEPPVLPKL